MDDWTLRPAGDHGLSYRDRLRSVAREDGLVGTSVRQAWWCLVRCHLSVWHRLTVSGHENLPRTFPFVMVANHTSHLDSMVLTAALPWRLRAGTCPLAAGDVFFDSPLVGALAAGLMNALPVWRRTHSGRALQALRQRLVGGDCGFVLFPEGTRSRDGQMTAFKSGVGVLVANTAVPVVPCRLVGCRSALPAGSKLPRPRRIELHVGPPLRFDQVSNDREGWVTTARALQAAVQAVPRRPAVAAPGRSWDEPVEEKGSVMQSLLEESSA